MRYRGIDDAQEYSYVWFNDDGKSVAVLHCVLWLNALTHSTHPHMLSNFSRTMNPFCARQFIIFANNETDSSRLSQQLMFAAADSKAKTNGTFEFFITFIPHVYREVAALSHTVRRHPAGIFFFLLLSASRMIYDREPARAHVCAREQQQQQNSRREKWNEKKEKKWLLLFYSFIVFMFLQQKFMVNLCMTCTWDFRVPCKNVALPTTSAGLDHTVMICFVSSQFARQQQRAHEYAIAIFNNVEIEYKLTHVYYISTELLLFRRLCYRCWCKTMESRMNRKVCMLKVCFAVFLSL